ncbi:hypothetical protein LJ737_04190 [Hymenobacter sp. 15J16-1T3B]|uniref:hypothetical protein n=1 Tax=Hymenobacter sp. 15J16-1T3B TaxID=2886941 RepID=UPI001D112D1E|nr:hypothetical protein [Hymenobacter sp. 15J16-1T3B]MCC3156422.1 hypothetical protein [Hymenobacter sp. 15J16-1T3B]
MATFFPVYSDSYPAYGSSQPAPQPLGTPTNFQATATSATSVGLAWSAAVGAPAGVQFVLQRSTAADFSANLITVYTGPNTSVNNVAGLLAATSYWYRVKATRSGYPDSGYATDDVTTPAGGGGGLQVFEPTAAQTKDGGRRVVLGDHVRYESFADRDLVCTKDTYELALQTTWPDSVALANLTLFVKEGQPEDPGEFVFFDQLPVTAGAVGRQYKTVSGLPFPCVLRIRDSGRRSSPSFSYTVFVGVRDTVAPTYLTQTPPQHRKVLIGDSRETNDGSTRPGYVGQSTTVRRRYEAAGTAGVIIRSTGGASFFSEFSGGDNAQREAYMETLEPLADGTVDTEFILALFRNDWYAGRTAAQYQADVDDFAQRFNTRFAGRPVTLSLQLPYPDFDAPGQANIPDYRTAMQTVAAARGLGLKEGNDLAEPLQDYRTDGVHFNNEGNEMVGQRRYWRLSGDTTVWPLTPDYFGIGEQMTVADVGIRILITPNYALYTSDSYGGEIALVSGSGGQIELYVNSATYTHYYHLDSYGGGVNNVYLDDDFSAPFDTFNTKSTTGADVPGQSKVFNFGTKRVRKLTIRPATGPGGPLYIWFFKGLPG